MRVVWAPTAVRRATEAVEFILVDRPGAAVEWYDGLIARVELLPEFPLQGRVVSEWDEESVREIMFDPYRVIYEVFEDHLEILTLTHMREDEPRGRRGGSL